MKFSVNLSLNFFMNFSLNCSGLKRVVGGKKHLGSFMAGYFIWRERNLFLGRIIFWAGLWTDPI